MAEDKVPELSERERSNGSSWFEVSFTVPVLPNVVQSILVAVDQDKVEPLPTTERPLHVIPEGTDQWDPRIGSHGDPGESGVTERSVTPRDRLHSSCQSHGLLAAGEERRQLCLQLLEHEVCR